MNTNTCTTARLQVVPTRGLILDDRALTSLSRMSKTQTTMSHIIYY